MTMDNPNWIAERAKCNLHDLWKDLCDIVAADVDRINDIAKEKSWGVYYSEPRGEEVGVIYRRGGVGIGECHYVYDSTQRLVQFTCQDPDLIAVLRTRWDAATSECRLVIELGVKAEDPTEIEFPHAQLWKAIQYILEPFFFTA